ncbi:hypothetical protein [Enterobacter cloacae]|uniref:hypothetical protein n=1 Tax=Enterobacter cloacae TaxID=550 RepID=UPI003ED7AB9D
MSVDNITVDTGFDNNDFLTSSTSYTLHGTLVVHCGDTRLSTRSGGAWMAALPGPTPP